MYPDFQQLFQSLFGTEMPEWLSIFKTFGFFVALAFLGAAWTAVVELKRKEQQGLLQPEYSTIIIGKPATTNELVWSAVIGFLLGYKIGGFYQYAAEIAPNPMGYLFSLKGNIIIGILGAAIGGYMRYTEKKKQALPEPQEKRIAIYPHQRMGEIVAIAAIGGLVGAKVFNAFETWEDFIANPVENLLSSSGLTFYGGLIVATVVFYYYSKKHHIAFHHLCDAVAPGLMLAYGVGRLGCHFAGDGDWGIFNSAYITEPNGALRMAAAGEFQQTLKNASQYFVNNFGTLTQVPHIYAPAPSWLPDWLYAMNYAHNVNNEGVYIANCAGNYCAVLPAGVFPTPIYEAVTCVLIFSILWGVRKRINYPLHLFGIYLIFNGVERFFVEKIRVNFKYDWGFLHPTQAEIISTLMVLAGLAIILFYKKKEIKKTA